MKRLVAGMIAAALGYAGYGHAQSIPTVVVQSTVSCATSSDGTVVGTLNPLQPPIVAAGFFGTLGSGNYYVQIAWYDAAAHVTQVSPEVPVQLSSTGSITVNLPAQGKPATAVGMNVYIGAASGAETLQGSTTGAATFTQSVPLITGAAEPTGNNTVCAIIANDAGWPSGTGYKMGMTAPSGAQMPGFPAQVQLLGPGGTINLGNGLPYYNGTVNYPVPILARPYNHAPQSISGPLSLTNYALTQVLKIGVGTQVPGWPIDVENGFINTNTGYLINGASGTTGQCLASGGAAGPNTWINCLTSVGTINYQTVQLLTTAQPQRAALNFGKYFNTADSASPSRTTITLTTTGIENDLVTAAAAGTGGHCAVWDGSGGIGDAGSGCAGPTTTTTCSGTSVPWACYRIEADGTIEEWGVSAAVATGADQNVVAITFPQTFTSTGNLSVVAVSDGCVDTCGGTTPKNPVGFSQVQGTLSTTGVTFSFTGVTPTGGGGGVLTATIHAHWHATGWH